MGKIILVTGGQRSGKSTYAEEKTLALAGSGKAIYMATSRIWDDEFAKRVQIHKNRRGEQWHNIEEEKYLHKHNVSGFPVLIDCVTLWATNFYFDSIQESENGCTNDNISIESILKQIKDEFEKFTAQEATFIFVTNEIGLGGVSENRVQRQFTDLLGWLNQYIASKADEVFFMVSGIPMRIK